VLKLIHTFLARHSLSGARFSWERMVPGRKFLGENDSWKKIPGRE